MVHRVRTRSQTQKGEESDIDIQLPKSKRKKTKHESVESEDQANGMTTGSRHLLFSPVGLDSLVLPFEYASLEKSSASNDLATRCYDPLRELNLVLFIDKDPDFSYKTALQEHIDEIEKALCGKQCRIMNEAYFMLMGALVNAENCRPSKFSVYMEKHWEAFGLMECVENFFNVYQKEFTKKKANRNLNRLWSPIAALAHWLKIVEPRASNSMWFEGRWESSMALLGNMMLSMLDQLEKSDNLQNDSRFEDLGLIIALYASIHQDHAVQGQALYFERYQWLDDIVEYVRKFGLEIPNVYGIKEVIEQHQIPPKCKQRDRPKPDRWRFARSFTDHRDMFGEWNGLPSRSTPRFLGGTNYNLRLLPPDFLKKFFCDNEDPQGTATVKLTRSGGFLYKDPTDNQWKDEEGRVDQVSWFS